MTELKEKKLSTSEKLDKIMEAVLFQHQLLVATIQAMDKILGEKKSSIIKL